MGIYADTSALFKRYVVERDSDAAISLLASDPLVHTARHTVVELRRNLCRLLAGAQLVTARRQLTGELAHIDIVELDAATCEAAATIAETTQVRTLDALHLAAAQRVGGGSTLSFVTFDVRQAQAARSLGFTVLGV